MGYYNDVAIGMSKNDGVKFLNDYAMEVSDSSLLQKGFELMQYPDSLVFFWRDVKWPDDDKDVRWIQNFLNALNDEGKPVAFIRIGEDLTDNEEWFCNDDDEILWNCFSLHRSISFSPTAA